MTQQILSQNEVDALLQGITGESQEPEQEEAPKKKEADKKKKKKKKPAEPQLPILAVHFANFIVQ